MKKTKTLLTAAILSVSPILYAQVGINTSNPQGTLHIDGAKDNPATGIPFCRSTSK